MKVQSSCGCATPKVEPTTIAPGEVGTVEVRAVPLQVGERMASVTLTTDSPASPEVILQLRIIGSRRPPFLARAGGELSFAGYSPETEVRKIHAFHIELKGSPPTPPLVKNDLPILEIGQATLEEEEPSVERGAVNREYVFEVKLAEKPPPGRITGNVFVVDPWDSTHVQRIRVHIEARPPLEAVPARVILQASKDRSVGEASEEILILSKALAPDLVVELDGHEESPLTVSPIHQTEGDRRTTFSVSLKPGAVREGEYNVLVGRASSPDRIIVPVAVRVEGSP